MLANNAEINWLPEHIKRRAVRQFPGIERRLGAVAASATGARRCRSGSANRPARWKRSAATTNCSPSRAWKGPKCGTRRSKPTPTAGRFEGSQAVHRRGHLRFAVRQGRAHEARDRSDRLLVRQRRDAVRPVGLSAAKRRDAGSSTTSSRPTSSAKPSTKPAAGSTANSRSARCCSASDEVRTAEHADAESHASANPHSAIPTTRIPSATASSSA